MLQIISGNIWKCRKTLNITKLIGYLLCLKKQGTKELQRLWVFIA
jgi:hypothetical protein